MPPYNPKPIRIKKPRKPLNRRGKVAKGNEAFTQERLEAWATAAILNNPSALHERDGNGHPTAVFIKTVDDEMGWINYAKERWTGVNVQVGHIEDKCLRPDLRWSVSNVAPITPACNQKMKFNLAYRKEMQERMRVWVSQHT